MKFHHTRLFILRETKVDINRSIKIRSRSENDTDIAEMTLLSTPMGVDYVVIRFDMEVQPLVTHNAA